MRWQNRWLCFGPLLFLALDVALTLAGQPSAYWKGDRGQVHEWSTYPNWLLRQHPLLLLVNAVVWASIFSAVILWLPASFGKVVSFVIHVGHTLGASSWIVQMVPGSWATAVLFIGLSVKFMDWTWGRLERMPI